LGYFTIIPLALSSLFLTRWRLTELRPIPAVKAKGQTTMTKQTILSDTDKAAIIGAKAFQVQILIGRGQFKKIGRPTLQTARDAAAGLEREVNNGRRCMIHAIHENRAILVPASFYPAAPAAAAKPKAGPAQAAKAKAAAKKTAKGKRAAKKPAGGSSKADIAFKMLTAAKGTTRAAIVEACGGWGIDLKQFAARKGLKLRRDADGTLFVTAGHPAATGRVPARSRKFSPSWGELSLRGGEARPARPCFSLPTTPPWAGHGCGGTVARHCRPAPVSISRVFAPWHAPR
jgi:hypothetical protein